MITEIGIIAGDIWHYLDSSKKGTLEEIVKATGKSKEGVLMGLGWLAREGHVTLIERSGTYEAVLSKEN